MSEQFTLISASEPEPSLARVTDGPRTPVTVGVVQHAWRDDAAALTAHLTTGIGMAADNGAQIVFLPELTLSRYPADTVPSGRADTLAEPLVGGQTHTFAAAAAARYGVPVHASLYQRTGDSDGRGLNTAIIVAPSGEIVQATHKLHIPVTAGYYEDLYFRPGPADGGEGGPHPTVRIPGLDGAVFGIPTCWDEWFPELARSYSLAGANVVVYATAIGSEPDHPEFDTRPLWQQVIVGNGIANGLFMIAPNRTGTETTPDGSPGNTFYGSSFVSDPYGRVLVQAPRDDEAVLIAALELEQRDDWLELFPFLRTRRPDSYGALTAPVDASVSTPLSSGGAAGLAS